MRFFTLLFLFLVNFIWSENSSVTEFATALIRVEQNVTDQDLEVVIEAKGGIEGLVKFSIVALDGRTLLNVNVPNSEALGLRHFNFESPEPKEIKSLKAAYPEGEYQFLGITASGAKLTGKAFLSYALALPSSVLHPKADAQQVSIQNLEISWSPVKDVVAYIISIEQANSNVNFTAKLPGSITKLGVPNGFLLPEQEYHLSIGTVTEKGNITYIETSFTTENIKKTEVKKLN